FFQAEDGIRDLTVTGVQTCALPILARPLSSGGPGQRRRARRRAATVGVGSRGGHGRRRTVLVDVVLCPARRAGVVGRTVGGAHEIGRASCRERGEMGVVGGEWKYKG